MRKLQKFSVTLEKGKETKRKPIGEPKKVIDSSVDHLVLESKRALNQAKESSKKSIKVIEVWEDQGEIVKGQEFDVNTAKKPDLLKYAEDNNIDLGEATKVDDIRKAIKDSNTKD